MTKIYKNPAATLRRSVSWKDLPFNRVRVAADVLGRSQAGVYALERAGLLEFVRVAGKTLVKTDGILRLLQAAEPWASSDRAQTAIEARRQTHAAREPQQQP